MYYRDAVTRVRIDDKVATRFNETVKYTPINTAVRIRRCDYRQLVG